MLLLDTSNTADYLRQTGRIGADEKVSVAELAGGVSNVVLYVFREPGSKLADFVVKQVRGKLRVPEPWYCSPERIWREVDVLKICHQALAGKKPAFKWRLSVPEVLWEDREQYAFGMTAISGAVSTWKELLLAGQARRQLAGAAAAMLARVHAATWGNAEIARALDDRQFFDNLRLDPYYRRVAQVWPDLRPALESLIDETLRTRLCLVHGDFSPKNLLVAKGALWLLDFEVGHYGDPAFDVGFFFTHLTLKAFLKRTRYSDYFDLIGEAFSRYIRELHSSAGKEHIVADIEAFAARISRHWGACLLARLDGKSQVDYLADNSLRAAARAVGRQLLLRKDADRSTLLSPVQEALFYANLSR